MDLQILYLLNNLAGKSNVLDSVIVFIASYLGYILFAVFTIALVYSAYSNSEKIRIYLTVLLAGIIARFGFVELIRYFYHRPRPFTDWPVTQLLTSTEWSFPSGHATFYFALGTAIFLYNKQWGTYFLIGAGVVGLSRIAAGVHYPSDILAGALVGIATAYVIHLFFRETARPATNQTP